MTRARTGEAMIWIWSVSQWQKIMRKGGEWGVALEGSGPEVIDHRDQQ